jgi:hypothetical protein
MKRPEPSTADRVRAVLDALPPEHRAAARSALRLTLFRQEPRVFARRVLKIDLDRWQGRLVDAPPGSRTIALVHRQAGKTSAAAVAVAHTMLYGPVGSTSLVLAPTQRQSGEAIRRIRGFLLEAGAHLSSDNAFSLQLGNGSRVLGLPGQDDAAIRGLTVDGVMVVDEAARVADALFQAAMPMVLRHARKARVMLLSTAWARDGFFYRLWSEGDARDWIKIEARIEDCRHLTPDDLERERRFMPTAVFAREYQNVFDSLETRFFDPDSLAAAFGDVQGPLPEYEAEDLIVSVSKTVDAGRAFGGAQF